MGIYTPEELANNTVPSTIPEAAAKGAINVICRGAPILAGYGLLTGNLPAVAFGTGGSIACGLPLFPVSVPTPPPAFIPLIGGQCPTNYIVQVRGRWRRGDGLEQETSSGQEVLPGAIGALRVVRTPAGPGGVSLNVVGSYRNGGAENLYLNVISSAPPNDVVWLYFAYSIMQRVDGRPDNCGNAPAVNPPIEAPYQVPPGYPDAPRLPGGGTIVPYKPPGSPASAPPYQLPIEIPDIPLPVIIPVQPTLNVPISAPISIPVSFPISVSPTVNGSITVQLDADGNVRTPPDLLCPCEYGVPDSPATDVVSVPFSVPYYECDPANSVKAGRVVEIQVLPDSLPSGLGEKLFDSAVLAQKGCGALSPEQKSPVKLSEGVVDGVLGRLIQVPLTDPDVACVRLKVFPQREEDFRETRIFEGAGQRLFAVIGLHLAGSQSSDLTCECWDMTTDLFCPRLGKPREVKILVKPGLRWELWDTGLRV